MGKVNDFWWIGQDQDESWIEGQSEKLEMTEENSEIPPVRIINSNEETRLPIQ
jgi:hypothetical protein